MPQHRSYYGSCLCEKVRFKITGMIENIVYCHCSQCRKAQGSAFAANGNVATEHFFLLQGKEAITAYQSTEKRTKFFCRYCGSPVFSKNTDYPDIVRLRIGTIESDIDERPRAHTFTASKACWEEINGPLPRCPEQLPENR